MRGRPARGPDRWIPGLRTLREYRRSWLASDPVAGVVLTALLLGLRPRPAARPPLPAVGTAVDRDVEATGTSWVDWEERLPR
jgi:hypothetical protein